MISLLPSSWSEWLLDIETYGKRQGNGSVAVVSFASDLSATCNISLESAMAQLLWLGSISLLTNVRTHWPSGVWQPSSLMITAVEEDGVGIEYVTNAIIDMAQDLGLDPIQDTVKEGPAGLISRLERRPIRWASIVKKQLEAENRVYENADRPVAGRSVAIFNKPDSTGGHVVSLEELATGDYSGVGAPEPSNVSNVRGLIYPNGRAFMSYLSDTPFFNTLDELTQHGNLNVRGKIDVHRLRHINLSLCAVCYQGALANLLVNSSVQNNLNLLLRQMCVLWDTSGYVRPETRGVRINEAIERVAKEALTGLDYLSALNAPDIALPELKSTQHETYVPPGVAVRFVTVNRYERLIRIAIAVMFWRITTGDTTLEITNQDLAVADAILHSHDMGARLLEVAASRGRAGSEAMRIFSSLLDGDSLALESIALASSNAQGQSTLQALAALSIVNDTGRLSDEYRFVLGDTKRRYQARWNPRSRERDVA